MIFLLYLSFFGLSLGATRLLNLPFLSLGCGYIGALFTQAACLFITGDLTKAAYSSTALLALVAGLAIWFSWKSTTTLLLKQHNALWVYMAFYVPLLFWQGAYLEIPADPIGVHLFRIGEWLRDSYIPFGVENNGPFSSTLYYGYLFNSAALALGPMPRHQGIEVLNFFNSLILAVAFYNTSYYFLKSSSKAVASLILAQLVMGISCYSYFRYYTFAPTLFNMVLFLDALVVLHSLRETQHPIRAWGFLAAAFAASWFTHKQEALMLFSATTVTCFYLSIPSVGSRSPRFFRRLGGALFLGAALGTLTGVWLGKIEIPSGKLLQDYLVLGKIQGLSIMMANPRSWHIRTTLNLSLLMCCAVVAVWAVRALNQNGWETWIRQRTTYLALLCAFPFLAAFFPPLSTFYSLFFYHLVFYRLLYFSFVFILVPLALSELYPKQKRRWLPIWGLALAAISYNCFWGKDSRGQHFMSRSRLDETYLPSLDVYEEIAALKLSKSTRNAGGITLYTDPVTAYPMVFLTGITTQTCYNWRCDFPGTSGQVEHSKESLKFYLGTVDYFLFNSSPSYSKSRFAGHWGTRVRDIEPYYDPQAPKWIGELVNEKLLSLVFQKGDFSLYKVDFQNASR